MAKPLLRVAVTGGAGQIAYSLLFRIASGELFGADQPVALHIVELPEAFQMLEGVKMELEDCAFPLLKEIHIGTDPRKLFEGIHWALLVGAKPRGPGMERADLLRDNGKIFIEQGRALNEAADPQVRVLVVGNPCNTNCLIALKQAPRIAPNRFYAMTRLDQNRGVAQLAMKAGVPVKSVTHLAIWGNHSSTQVPDFSHARIGGAPVEEKIRDKGWLEGEFFSIVQKRGAAIIAARGKSSAASAANAVIDTVHSLIRPTPADEWYSCGVFSEGNPYGIDPNLIFSFPCRTHSDGSVEIVKGLRWSDFIKAKVLASERELIEERTLANVGER